MGTAACTRSRSSSASIPVRSRRHAIRYEPKIQLRSPPPCTKAALLAPFGRPRPTECEEGSRGGNSTSSEHGPHLGPCSLRVAATHGPCGSREPSQTLRQLNDCLENSRTGVAVASPKLQKPYTICQPSDNICLIFCLPYGCVWRISFPKGATNHSFNLQSPLKP